MPCTSSSHDGTAAEGAKALEAAERNSWRSSGEHGTVDWVAGITQAISEIWCVYWLPLTVFGAVIILCHLGFIRTSISGIPGRSAVGGPSGRAGGDIDGDDC